MGLDTDNVDAGGEGGDVEVRGVVEGGHLASVHIHNQHFYNLVNCADDVDLAGGGIGHQTRVGVVTKVGIKHLLCATTFATARGISLGKPHIVQDIVNLLCGDADSTFTEFVAFASDGIEADLAAFCHQLCECGKVNHSETGLPFLHQLVLLCQRLPLAAS